MAKDDLTGADAIDLSTTAGKLADLRRRVAEVANAGSTRAVEKQHAKSRRPPGSGSSCSRRGLVHRDGQSTPGTAATSSARRSTGRMATASSPATACAATAGSRLRPGLHRLRRLAREVFGGKIVKIMDFAMKVGCPVVGIPATPRAPRIRRVVSLRLYGEIFRLACSPRVSSRRSRFIAGPAPAAGLLPAVTDFTVMVDQTSHMFITGPDVIKTVTGRRSASKSSAAPGRTTPSRAMPTTWAPTRTTPSSTSRRCCRFLPSNNHGGPAGRRRRGPTSR